MNDKSKDQHLGKAIEQGYLDSANQESPELAEQWAAHQKVESLFANLRGAAAIDEPEQEAPLPTEIGPYLIKELLGQGTFGNVYLGYDAKLERQVAIKVPRQSLLAESSNDQFMREARTAAQLNHPNIVSVFEVAQEEDRTYIVSDFIDGVPMDQWRKDDPLKADDAAKLCLTISAAVTHAHEQGVIHRDLKPSNIMMDKQDNPFVMDFGLAKRQSTDATMTMEGKILGTPAYMSPEQARGDNSEVDARADVYALGVILFELLTGERPFRGSTQMLLHQVIHEDAPDPRKLNSHVPRDLSTICLKCLEKSPDGRYPSVNDFAEDITRYLEKRPITARPLGRVGRTLRWCLRRPLVAGLSTAVIISLLAGTSISIYYGITADQERVKAAASEVATQSMRQEAQYERQRATEANAGLSSALQAELHQKQDADESRRLARTVVNELLVQLSEVELISLPGTTNTRKALLIKARDSLRIIIQQSQGDATLLEELAYGHHKLGVVLKKLGELPDAKSEFQAATNLYTRLYNINKGEQRLKFQLAECILDLSSVDSQLGSSADAITSIESSRRLLQSLIDSSPKTASYRIFFLKTFLSKGRYYERFDDLLKASHEFKYVIDYSATHFENKGISRLLLIKADAHAELAALQQSLGQFNESADSYKAAIQVYQQLESLYPGTKQYELANTHLNAASMLAKVGRLEDAQPYFIDAEARFSDLCKKWPSVIYLQNSHTAAIREIARHHRNSGRLLEAKTVLEKAIEIDRRVFSTEGVALNLKNLDLSLSLMSGVMHEIGEKDLAVTLARESLKVNQQKIDLAPDVLIHTYNLAVALSNLATMLDSDPYYQTSSYIREKRDVGKRGYVIALQLMESNPSNTDYKVFFIVASSNYCCTFPASDVQMQTSTVIPIYVKALKLLDELSASNSDILFYSARYGALLPNLATAYKNIGQPKQAIQCYLRAAEISRRLVKAYPDLPRHKYDLAIDLRRLAGLQRSETPDKSIETLREGIDLHEQLLAQTPNNPMYRYTLAIALYEQAVALTFLPETFQRSSDLFARSMKIQGQLIRDDTQQSSEYMIGYTMAATHYFMLLEKQNLFEDAIPISRSLIQMWEEFDNSHGQIEVIGAIAGTRLSLSRQLYLSGNSPDGLIEFRNAISACLEARQYQVIYNKATQVATFTSISPGRWKYAAFASLIASSVHAQSDVKLTLQDRENVLSANLSLATMLFRQLIETKYFTLADNRKRLISESFYDDPLMDDFRHVGIE